MIIRYFTSILIYLLCSYALANPVALNPTSEQYWQTFRHQNPLFIQDVMLSSPLEDGSRLLLLTEPPPLLYSIVEKTLLDVFGEAYQGHEIFTQRIGFDGWVKDIVVRLDYGEQSQRSLRRDIAVLHQELFGTDYKANYRLFDVKPWSNSVTLQRQNGAPPDMQVSSYSMHQWFFGDSPVQFYERTADRVGFKVHSYKPVTLEQAFKTGRSGVFYAVDVGVVVLLVDRARQLNGFKPLLRQFFLDTDVLFGAISPSEKQSKMLALVGRERDTSLAAMPPLRVETVFTLAASEEENLAQSFELLLPLADKTTDSILLKDFFGINEDETSTTYFLLEMLGLGSVDWAPILLSHDLTHTEYGNLLNVTDQIIKTWSESNKMVLNGHFPYRAPWEYPYSEGIFSFLKKNFEIHTLVYNWNTTGFGTWVNFEKFSIFALYRTGALPLSYIPYDLKFNYTPEIEDLLVKLEDKYWKFFAELRDPNLNRAAQYAALHIIFQKYAVNAVREEFKIPKAKYDQRWEAMELETFEALTTALEQSDKSLKELQLELESNQCMSSFKQEHLQEWEDKRQLIVDEIKKFSTKESLHDLSRILTSYQSFLNPIYQSLDAEKLKLSLILSDYQKSYDRVSDDIRYCKNLLPSNNRRYKAAKCDSIYAYGKKLEKRVNQYNHDVNYCNHLIKNNDARYAKSNCHLMKNRRKNLQRKIDKHQADEKFCNNIKRNINARIKASDCHLIEDRAKAKNKKAKKLEKLINQLDALNKKIVRIKEAPIELSNIAVEVFGDCSKAWQGIVAEQKDFSSGFIKTPSIVVSSNPTGYGGHNIDGNSIKTILDSSISPSSYKFDPDTQVLKIHPDNVASTNAITKAIERLKPKPEEGSAIEQQRLDEIIKSLSDNTPSVNAIDLLPDDKTGFNFFEDERENRNTIVGGVPSEPDTATIEKAIQTANDLDVKITIEKKGVNYQIAYIGKENIIIRQVNTTPELQYAIEGFVDQAIHDDKHLEGNIAIAVLGDNIPMGDIQALYMVARARQASLSKFSDGQSSISIVKAESANNTRAPPYSDMGAGNGKPPEPPALNESSTEEPNPNKKILTVPYETGTLLSKYGLLYFSTNFKSSSDKKLLARTDADWSAATIETAKIISRHDDRGTIVTKLKVPFKKRKMTDQVKEVFIKITSFFKRKPDVNDTKILDDVISDALSVNIPNGTIADRIGLIREEYKRRVGEDAYLRFHLQPGVQDMHIVEKQLRLKTHERG